MVENVSPFWTKRYPLPLLDFNYFPNVNIEQQECCVNFGIFRGSFGQFYALIEFFQCIYVHNLNLNYMHMLQFIQLG